MLISSRNGENRLSCRVLTLNNQQARRHPPSDDAATRQYEKFRWQTQRSAARRAESSCCGRVSCCWHCLAPTLSGICISEIRNFEWWRLLCFCTWRIRLLSIWWQNFCTSRSKLFISFESTEAGRLWRRSWLLCLDVVFTSRLLCFASHLLKTFSGYLGLIDVVPRLGFCFYVELDADCHWWNSSLLSFKNIHTKCCCFFGFFFNISGTKAAFLLVCILAQIKRNFSVNQFWCFCLQV